MYMSIFAAVIGAVCCFSADSHGTLYNTLLSKEHTGNAKTSTYNTTNISNASEVSHDNIRDTYVEGTVSKIEEKSKCWIYLKNTSIQYSDGLHADGEGVIVLLADSDSDSPRPLAGSRIIIKGELSLFSQATNPGEFDSRSYYHSLGYDFCLSADAGAWTQKGTRYDPIAEWLWQLKTFIKKRLSQLISGQNKDWTDYGIYCAVLLGDKSELDSEQKALFQEQGIAHILSVSGLHISAVGLVTCGLLMKLTGSFAISGIVGSLTVLFYAAFTGNAISTIRACIMYLILTIGRQKGRIYDMPTAASAAALCLLFFQPLAIFQASMQLSFGAILGISLVSDFFRRIPNKLSAKASMKAGRFFTVMGLSVTMLPVILYHYYQYPLYSLLLNQLVIPLAGLLIAAPVAALIMSAIWLPAASAFLLGGHLVISLYTILCEVFSTFPLSTQYVGRPAVWRIFLYYALLGILGVCTRWLSERRKKEDERRKKEKKRSGLIIAVSLTAGYYLFGCFFLHADRYKGLEITVLDVGQGDGIVLTLPDQTTILSDGGSSSRYQLETSVLEPFLKVKGISRFDYVFISHTDSDHISGILGLMEENPELIGTLMLPQSQNAAEQFEKLMTLAQEKQIPVTWLSKGERISSDVSNLSFEILWPEKTLSISDTNALSLVWRLSYQNFSMIFMGDIPGEYESSLDNLKPTSILKVAHHGSNYSTTESFLQRVQPTISVISCSANNRYGHPGVQTLKRLEDANAQSIFITKDCGAITIRTDGSIIEVKTFLEPAI